MSQASEFVLVISPTVIPRPDFPSNPVFDRPMVVESQGGNRKAVVIANYPSLYETGEQVIEFIECMLKSLLGLPTRIQKSQKIVISLESENHLRIVRPIAQELLPGKLTWQISRGLGGPAERLVRESGHAKACMVSPNPEYYQMFKTDVIKAFLSGHPAPEKKLEEVFSRR